VVIHLRKWPTCGSPVPASGEAGYEFSHWIPNRWGGPRSIFNGNYVSEELHYLTDPFRYPSGWQDFGPKLPAVAQQLLRIPWVYDGAAAGAAYGGASAMHGRNCGYNLWTESWSRLIYSSTGK